MPVVDYEFSCQETWRSSFSAINVLRELPQMYITYPIGVRGVETKASRQLVQLVRSVLQPCLLVFAASMLLNIF
jgi:hypothetical protein